MKTYNASRPLVPARTWHLAAALVVTSFLCLAMPGLAQVSPAEVSSPELKAAEAQYLPQLKQISHSITQTKFPFSFFLSRYVGLDPAQQVETDSRGLEFVKFHDRVVLKVTGNYNVAYNAGRVTQNERASHTFHEVIIPVVRTVTDQIPKDATCDAIGFEISYHTRTDTSAYDYEGKEILVVVFEKNDAFAFAQATDDSSRQEILNRSEVYLNGTEYGLSLSGPDPLIVGELDRSNRAKPSEHPSSRGRTSSARPINSLLSFGKSSPAPAGSTAPDPSFAARTAEIKPVSDQPAGTATMTQADADKIQVQYQPQLDAFAKEGAARFHFVDYAPPSFVLFQNRVVLQITLRNPARFDADKSSIYKRAAQSFDLFVAPLMKDVLEKIPITDESAVFDFTIVNQLAAEPHASSEAVEFVIPVKGLRQFVDAEITNQQLIDQGVVLVNGVRIALNLQLVE